MLAVQQFVEALVILVRGVFEHLVVLVEEQSSLDLEEDVRDVL